MKKMLLIINPKSGISKKQKVFDDVVKIINDNEWEVKTIYTERRGHATAIAKKAKGFERIVCMGGDGTFNETINGLMLNPHKTDLGYIPSGSTNDFASGLGLPKIFAKSAKFAANQSAFPTDLGMFKGDIGSPKYFSYVASFGMFTEISYSTDQSKKNAFGHLAYILEALRTVTDFSKIRPFKMRIELHDGDTFESEFIFGAITNSTSLGGLVKLDKKNVHVSDGAFEMILIKKPKNFAALTQTVTELINNNFTSKNIIFCHVEKTRFISEKPLKWTLDGEYAGEFSTVDISVEKGAIDLVRPTVKRIKPFPIAKKL